MSTINVGMPLKYPIGHTKAHTLKGTSLLGPTFRWRCALVLACSRTLQKYAPLLEPRALCI